MESHVLKREPIFINLRKWRTICEEYEDIGWLGYEMEFQRAWSKAMGQEAERTGWTDTGGLESHEKNM